MKYLMQINWIRNLSLAMVWLAGAACSDSNDQLLDKMEAAVKAESPAVADYTVVQLSLIHI